MFSLLVICQAFSIARADDAYAMSCTRRKLNLSLDLNAPLLDYTLYFGREHKWPLHFDHHSYIYMCIGTNLC
jgi:hypothetical protein